MSGATIAPSHRPFYHLFCDLQVDLDEFEHFIQIFWHVRFYVKNRGFLRQKPVFLAFLTFFTCFYKKDGTARAPAPVHPSPFLDALC